MRWIYIDSGAKSGRYNMDFDVFLANKCKRDEAFFRLYQWNPYAISLGANQKFDEVDSIKAQSDYIDVVKRPTGGRAILHSEELTYSLIIPIEYGLSAREVYDKTSITLSQALGLYDKRLKSVELENAQPDFRNLLSQPSGSLCFASTAKSEVKFRGKKIIGSAQRKMNTAILQHGSILCGRSHTKLPKYLADKTFTNKLIDEISSKTIEISTVTNESVNYSRLSQSIINSFESEWELNFDRNSSSIITEFERTLLAINEV